ncbi:hypothetical protein NSX63_23550, partial [Salmonella enterica]|nr:hypothetical protein [Salmonella enterica]
VGVFSPRLLEAALFILILGYLLLACAAPVLTKWMGPRVFLVAALAPAATLAWTLRAASRPAGDAAVESVSWVPALGLDISFRADGLTLL